MTPEQAAKEAAACACLAFSEYISEMTRPNGAASQSLRQDADPRGPAQILSACYRLAHRLYNQSHLPQTNFPPPEFPDPPPGVILPDPAELLASLTPNQGE